MGSFPYVSSLKLKSLYRFTSTATAVEEITAINEGKLGKGLKKFLNDEIVEKGKGKDSLMVADSKLGASVHRSYLRKPLICLPIASPTPHQKTRNQCDC